MWDVSGEIKYGKDKIYKIGKIGAGVWVLEKKSSAADGSGQSKGEFPVSSSYKGAPGGVMEE